MTLHQNDTALSQIYDILTEAGFSSFADALTILLNEAMKIERSAFLQAQPYERSEQRRGYANGFKQKTLRTRLGEVTVAVPQVRDSDFYPSALEKGTRSERALKAALAEMYLQGVSTRKVAAITEELCGFEVSSTTVSRATAELDGLLSAWRERPLAAYRYVVLDARYEHVRHGGTVVDAAVLLAIGVSESNGKREVLGASVALSEQEVHWRTFLQSLKKRGLHGVQLLVSDAHEGLLAAKRAVFPSVPWQRCQVHLQRNAQKYVPRKELKQAVASDIRAIFNAPNRSEADRLLDLFIERYSKTAPRLTGWAETALQEGFAVFEFPEHHRRRLRSTNALERLNQAIKQRTKVASIFPNEASCLRLVTAIVMEISDEWVSGKRYLTLDDI